MAAVQGEVGDDLLVVGVVFHVLALGEEHVRGDGVEIDGAGRQEPLRAEAGKQMAAVDHQDGSHGAVLLGCGLRRLSVSPRQVPVIKRRIRGLSLARLRDLVETCSQLATAREIEGYLDSALGEDLRTTEGL